MCRENLDRDNTSTSKNTNNTSHKKRNNDNDKASDAGKELYIQKEKSDNVDSEGFMLPRNRKKKKNVIGSRKVSSSVLKCAMRTADLYIGNCDPGVTVDILSTYIKEDLNIDIVRCEKLQSRYDNYSSFKVTLNVNDRIKLLSSEVWPDGVVCRKFFSPRNNHS